MPAPVSAHPKRLPISGGVVLFLALLDLGSEVPLSRRDLYTRLVELHLESVGGAIRLDFAERDLEQVQVLGASRQAFHSTLQIVVVMKESTAGSLRQFRHDILIRLH